MKKGIQLLLCSLLLLSGCGSNPTLEKFDFSTTTVGFDTFVSFTGYTTSQEEFDRYTDILSTDFTKYNQLFDRYNTYDGVNNIKTINDNAGVAPIQVEPELYEMVELAKTYDELSNGKFAITLGPVLDLWHDAREIAEENPSNAYVPTEDALQEANTCTSLDNLVMDKENQTIYLKESCASLDVGGIAKGFAVEKVVQHLIDEGLTSGIVNAGGNVRIIGEKPSDSTWKVGIQTPKLEDVSTSLLHVNIEKDMSFVTSGDYQRFYMYEGQMIHHIIDPSTLHPSTYMKSVTVLTKDSGIADALSTILFTSTYEEGNALLDKLREDGLDVEAIWIFNEDQLNNLPDGAEVVPSNGYYIISTKNIEQSIELK